MLPDRRQQALAGLAVLLVVLTTIGAGLLLTVTDNPRTIAGGATPTRFLIPTLPPGATGQPSPTPLVTRELTPTATPTVDFGTDDPTETPTLTETAPPTEPPPSPTRLATNTHPPHTPDWAPPAATRTPRPTSTLGLPIVTPGGDPTQTQTATDGACTYATSTITQPLPGDDLSGVVRLRGSADFIDFDYYKIEIRSDSGTPEDYVTVHTGERAVLNGLLMQLDTRAYTDGLYWLRLVVVDSTGNYPERCAILVRIDN